MFVRRMCGGKLTGPLRPCDGQVIFFVLILTFAPFFRCAVLGYVFHIGGRAVTRKISCQENIMDDIRVVLKRQDIDAELLDLGVAMTTVQAAAEKLGVPPRNIFKSLVVCGPEKSEVAIIVLPGDARADLKAVAKALSWKKVRFADPEVVLRETGYPAGGTPPIGHHHVSTVIVDEELLQIEEGYGGGGRPELLLRIAPSEIIRVTHAVVAKISKCEGRKQ